MTLDEALALYMMLYPWSGLWRNGEQEFLAQLFRDNFGGKYLDYFDLYKHLVMRAKELKCFSYLDGI